MISSEIGANSFLSHFEKLELAFPEGNTEKIQFIFSLIENAYLKLINILNVLKLSIDKDISEVSEISTFNNNKGYILVIDDDSVFRVLLTELLQAMNYEVEVASSGLEGLEKAYTRLPDLVLLDAIMDGIDGFETCKIFKSDQRLSPVPIVMVTGLDDSESISHAFDVGATNFISKPVQPMLLENQIRFIFRTMDIESQLRESESKLKISQRLARLGHWRLNARSGVFECSEQLAGLCDSNNNIQSCGSFATFLMNIHINDRVYVLDTIGAAFQGQATEIIKYRLKLNDEDELHVEQFIEVLHGGTQVESILGTVQDVSRQRDAENSIRQIAYQDNLTGLASRGYFMEHLDEVIKTANRQGGQIALLLIDLDGFKTINDSLGHDAGDSLLKQVATRLKGTLRKSDFIARLGGDEFCLLISEISKENSTAKIAVNCLQAVTAPLVLNGRTLKPEISIGIAHYPNDADSKDRLLKAADIAMYDAKRDGKQHYSFFNKQMMEQAEQSFAYEQELNVA
ncbi:MAG: diguanylate cyclase, partial [Gammaproteobacteria bacterium]|nr:diguanylate cyclase [Gammaproteobacteria bacterium]